jgi:hypothetical protein
MKIENIKFKAKRLDNGEWVEGSLIRSTDGIKERAYIVDNFSSMNDYSIIGVAPSTVCQFTGFKDIEGNEVWEGDILDGRIKGEVVFMFGTFALHPLDCNKREVFAPLYYFRLGDKTLDLKVIGNKFDK